MTDITKRATDTILWHMGEIKLLFKNPKVTIVVRNPDLKDGDLIVTEDNIYDVIASIKKLQERD